MTKMDIYYAISENTLFIWPSWSVQSKLASQFRELLQTTRKPTSLYWIPGLAIRTVTLIVTELVTREASNRGSTTTPTTPGRERSRSCHSDSLVNFSNRIEDFFHDLRRPTEPEGTAGIETPEL